MCVGVSTNNVFHDHTRSTHITVTITALSCPRILSRFVVACLVSDGWLPVSQPVAVCRSAAIACQSTADLNNERMAKDERF